jgi:hypothetical protein
MHQYYISFTRKGGNFDARQNFANAYVRAGETVTLSGSPGNYQVRIT